MSDHNEAGDGAGAQPEGTADRSHDAQVDHNGEDGTGHGQGDDGGSNAGSQGQSRSSRRAGGSAGASATHSGDGDGDDGGSAKSGQTPGKRSRDGAPTSTAGAGTKDEEEERLRKRRRQNRESAAVCRERRKKELADARAEAQALRSANDQLRKLIVEQRLRMAEAEQMAASLSHGMPNFAPAAPTQVGLGDGGAAPGTMLSAASTAERSALNNIWMQQLRASLWQAERAQQQQPASAQAPAHSGPSAAAVAGSGAGAGAGAGAGTGMSALYQRALQAAGFQRGMASRSPAVSAAMNAIAGGANQRPHGTGAQASPTGIHAPSAQALYQQQRAPGAANPPLNGQPPGSIAQTLQLMAGGRVPMALARADNRGYLLLPMNAMSGRVDPTVGVNANALRGLLGSALGAGAPAGTPSSGLGKRMQ